MMVVAQRACVDPAWPWGALREELVRSPRPAALALAGLALFILGVAAKPDAVGGLSLVGAGLATAGLVLPIVTKVSVGSVSVERSEPTRESAVSALAEELGPTLREVGRWVSAGEDEDRISVWVRQALALACRDCLLVPTDQRDAHALCLLVRAIRGGMGMRPPSPAPEMSGVLTPRDLAVVPFDDRAALVLRRVALVEDHDGAHVLHCTVEEFAARVVRAEAQLVSRGVAL
jgi:hypothetical protein